KLTRLNDNGNSATSRLCGRGLVRSLNATNLVLGDLLTSSLGLPLKDFQFLLAIAGHIAGLE
ncbi:hypothetical protein, partial [Roseibacillus persicicus]|uniref:hypothetical protein n=1 Tax=Roseibacillus persicicus TaxID=454148 RepID=UPI0035E8D344